MTFSVIVPYKDKNSNIARSYDYLCRQQEDFEVIIVNNTPGESEAVSEIERNDSQRVVVVNISEADPLNNLLNEGVGYASGDYVVFLKAGDILNPKVFAAISELSAQYGGTGPDIVSFELTCAMEEFEYFDDEPFELGRMRLFSSEDKKNYKKLITGDVIDERYMCHAYKREFLTDCALKFDEREFEDNSTFLYTLLFMAQSLVFIPEHGYCRYEKKYSDNPFKQITDNMNAQLSLLELLQGIPEIMAEYGDAVIAHFLKKYYLHSIEIARALDVRDEFPLTIFQTLQFVSLKVAPKWIENEYIFVLCQRDRQLLSLLYRQFDSGKELCDELYGNALVSVIINTYNRAKVLTRAVENILSQTWQRFELIIVDDGSADETQEVAKSFTDDRIRFFRSDKNLGIAASRNIAITNAKGAFITFQDDDDLCRLEKLEEQVTYMLHDDNEIGMVYHESINHIGRLEDIAAKVVVLPSRNMADCKKSGYILPALLPWNFVTGPSMMIRRECFEKTGLFNEKLFAFEDWDMTLRLVRDFRTGFIRKPLYDYYQSSRGLLFNNDPEHRKKVVDAISYIDEAYESDRKEYAIESIKK